MSRSATSAHGSTAARSSYDFIGHRRRWYGISAVLLLISIAVAARAAARRWASSSAAAPSSASRAPRSTRPRRCATPSARSSAARSSCSASGRTRSACRPRSWTAAEVEEVQTALAERSTSAVDDVSTQFIGPSWGQDISTQGAARPRLLPARGRDLPVAVLRVEDGARGDGRAAARPGHHHRDLLAGRLRGHPGDRHRLPDDPRLLALRHRRRVRQGAGEHRRAWPAAAGTTYSGAANLAVNQTLVRSINTSIIALLPIGCDPLRRAWCCSAPGRSRTWRWRCSSASRSAPTPRSSSPPRCSPGSRSASPRCRRWPGASPAASSPRPASAACATAGSGAPAPRGRARTSRRGPEAEPVGGGRPPPAAVGAGPAARRPAARRPARKPARQGRQGQAAATGRAGRSDADDRTTPTSPTRLLARIRDVPGLPEAGHRLQGHHAAARRPRVASPRPSTASGRLRPRARVDVVVGHRGPRLHPRRARGPGPGAGFAPGAQEGQAARRRPSRRPTTLEYGRRPSR